MNKNQKSTNGKSKSMNSSSKPRKARVQNKQKPKNGGGAQKQNSVASAYSSQQMGKAPIIKQSKDSVRITHRELIGNVTGAATTAFTNSFTLELNPGILATFPWLSTIAQNWETYLFLKARLCYYTRTGSTTAGSVVIAPDYDAADASPPTEQIISSYQDVVEDVPWKDIVCTLRHSAMHPEGKRKYIRTEALANNLDIKTYDAANLFVFTVDSAAAAAWGKIWIEYEVVLFTPHAQTGLPVGLSGGSFFGSSGMTAALPLGTVSNAFSGTAGITYNTTTGALTFQKSGWYLIAINLTGTGMSAPVYTLSNMTNQESDHDVNAAGTSLVAFVCLSADAANATCIFSLTAATVTACRFFIGSAPTSSLD
jgi:hypothetical protein